MGTCKHCHQTVTGKHDCPVANKVIDTNDPNDNGDFVTSMLVGAMTDNAIIGGVIGGSMLGGICGDMMGDGGLF